MFIKHLPYKRLTEGKRLWFGKLVPVKKTQILSCIHALCSHLLAWNLSYISKEKKFLSGPLLKIPLMWNPCCVKQKKKKIINCGRGVFPADCKCIFLCCFLNDLGNYRNHETINTYILFLDPLLYTIQTF